MRILLVNTSARVHTGGVNRMVVESCDWLQRGGHTVALAYEDGAGSQAACRVYALPPKASVPATEAAMKSIVADFQPEVVQLHKTLSPWFNSAIATVAPTCRFIHDQGWFCSSGDRMAADFTACHRPHGASCLFWHYAQGCGGKNPFGNWERWRLVQEMNEARHTPRLRFQIASRFMLKGLLENGYREEQIDVLPLFALAPETPISYEPGLMLVASRLVAGKGVDFLMDAVKLLPAIPWQLLVAGEGPQLPELENQCRKLGLQDRVRFLGELSPKELEVWFARVSMVITPTLRQEPFGLIGLEAMAYRKPVVAFDGGATEEWLRDGQTGIVVRERTHVALASAITELLQQPKRGRQLGEQGRKDWEQFRPEIFVERLVASFKRCIDEFGHRGMKE